MALDTRYLKKHGNQWVVIIKVPERLRPVVGRAHLKQPLHTSSLAVANREKFKHVAAMKEQLEQAERAQRRKDNRPPDTLTEEALQWRESIAQADRDPKAFAYVDEDGETVEDARDITLSLLTDRAEEVERREGPARAKAFYDVARGDASPVLSLVDRWLSEKAMKPRQKTDYRRAVAKLEAWLGANKLPATIEGCSRKIAGRYVTEAFVEPGVNPKTANKDISCLSSYWKWLKRRGQAEENPWLEQALDRPDKTKGEDKRPYTDEEMRVLFSGNASPLLRDMMAIAALSGMRVEEIARLTAGDISNDCFDIPVAKTRAGVRMVPIHPTLASVISRRVEGKGPKDPLFPELPVPKEGSPIERSQKVVKAFTAYRRRVGVNDVLPGARQSRVDFHSFRRWFITKAEQAHQPVHFIEALVGHKRKGESLGRYSGGPLVQQFRDVVASVRLPEGCKVGSFGAP